MTYIWIAFLLVIVTVSGDEYIGTQTFVINSKTGMLYPPTIPVFVKPGDHILLCAPPGMSRACYTMVNGTCLTLRNACVSKIIDNTYPHGATLYFNTSAPTLYVNKVQPWPDPLVHCLVLFGRHKILFSNCVEAFSKYENVTDTSTGIDIGPGCQTLMLTAMPQVSAPFHISESKRLPLFIAQIIFILVTIPLFLMKSNICTN